MPDDRKPKPPTGSIDVMPELMPCIDMCLPRGVTIISSQPYGGAMSLEISGDGIEDGVNYQLITTDDTMKRTYELVKSPNQ